MGDSKGRGGRGGGGGGGATPTQTIEQKQAGLRTLVKGLEDELGVTIDAFINRNTGAMSLDRIVVPAGQRERGTGSRAMRSLTGFADRTGTIMTLTPSPDFGGSVRRLRPFYRRFGFVNNSGRNKDFRFRDTMLRQPGGG